MRQIVMKQFIIWRRCYSVVLPHAIKITGYITFWWEQVTSWWCPCQPFIFNWTIVNFKGDKILFKIVIWQTESYTHCHFIWNLWNSPKACFINFKWNNRSCKILYFWYTVRFKGEPQNCCIQTKCIDHVEKNHLWFIIKWFQIGGS